MTIGSDQATSFLAHKTAARTWRSGRLPALVDCPAPPLIGVIIVDSREKQPYRFSGRCARAALKVGDYSVVGLESSVAIERKGYGDLYSCLTVRRKEFLDQLKALSRIPHRALVVDTSVDAILFGNHYSKVAGHEALRRLISMCSTRGIPLYFAGGNGPLVTGMLLAEFAKRARMRKVV